MAAADCKFVFECLHNVDFRVEKSIMEIVVEMCDQKEVDIN
jgi:hypothetical protein